jgi:tetratricopeptide (TPR) repeat protein
LSAALSIQRKVLSPDDPDLLYTLNSLGLVLENENRWPEAESVWRESLDGWRKRAGDGDMKTEYAMYNLTLSLEAQNKWPEAETLRRSELTSLRKRVGNDDPQTLYAMGHLATVLDSEEKWPEAESLYREELTEWRKLNGNEDKEALDTMDNLLSDLESEKKWADAETVLRDEWSWRRKQFGDNDPNTLYAWRKVGLLLEEEGKWADAATIWNQSLAPWRKQEGSVAGQQSMYTLRKLGLALEAESKWPEAETVFREALTISRKQGGNEGDEALADLERLARVLMPQKKFADTQNLLDGVLTPAFAGQKQGQDLLLTWVNMMGRCGQWQEATTDAVLLVQYQPADHYNYHRLAGLLAMTQNRSAYEQICQRFVTTFTNTADAYVDERQVQDCLLLPHSGVDLQLIDNRADAAITFGKDNDAIPYFQACKAMSDYRLGRYAAAIEWADKSEKSSQVNAEAKAYAISAMAHWQLGQKDIAQTMLAKGDALAPGISKTQGTVDLGESWVAWLIARVSLDEATALFQSGSTTNAASGQP